MTTSLWVRVVSSFSSSPLGFSFISYVLYLLCCFIFIPSFQWLKDTSSWRGSAIFWCSCWCYLEAYMHSQHVDTIHILGSSKMLLGKGYCYANKKLINCLSGFIDTYQIKLSKSDIFVIQLKILLTIKIIISDAIHCCW